MSDQSPQNKTSSTWTLILFIFFVGFLLRIWGIGFGLPYLYHPDEQKIVSTALGFGAGDLNPHFFKYPSLYMYLQFALYAAWFVLGRIFGLFASSYDFALAFAKDPSSIYLIGRSLTALFGALTIPFIYGIGRRLFGRTEGLIGAAFFAFALLAVQDAHFVTTDVPMTFFMTAALYFAVRHAQSGAMRSLIRAAVFCGLAASTKYNGASVFVAVILAIGLAPGAQGGNFFGRWAGKRLWTAVVVCLAVFIIGTPYALLDFSAFVRDVGFEFGHASKGHLGFFAGQSGWAHHFKISLGSGISRPILLLGAVSILGFLFSKKPERKIVAGFALLYFLAIGASNTLFQRYALPLVPVLCIFAARPLVWVGEAFIFRPSIKTGVTIGLALLLILPNLARSLMHDWLLTRTDTRTEAMEWVRENLKPGDRIVVDGYGPRPPDFTSRSLGSPKVRGVKDRIKDELAKTETSYRVIDLSIEGRYNPEWIERQNPKCIFVSSFIEKRMREKAHRTKSEVPYFDWLENGSDYRLVKTILPWSQNYDRASVPEFDMKSLYSPSKGAMFHRSRPGPVIGIYCKARLPQ